MQRKRRQSCSTITSLIMMNKKKRSENFSRSEVLILIDIVEKYKITVENKKTNAAAWAEKKLTWEQITAEFNQISGNPPRTWKTLKLKYDGMKKEIRRKQVLMKKHLSRNGHVYDGVRFLRDYEERVLSIMQLGVSGYNSGYEIEESEQPSRDGNESTEFIKIEDLGEGDLEFEHVVNNEHITGDEYIEHQPSTSNDASIQIFKVEERDNEIQNIIPHDNISGVGTRVNEGNARPIPIRRHVRKRHPDQFLEDIQMQRLMILKRKVLLLQESLLKDEIESKRQSRKIEQEILKTNLETAKVELKIKQKMLEQMEQ